MKPAIPKPIQARVHRLYEDGKTTEQISEETGVKIKTIHKLLVYYRDWKKGLRDSQYTGMKAVGTKESDPTPEEIEQAKSEIRRKRRQRR